MLYGPKAIQVYIWTNKTNNNNDNINIEIITVDILMQLMEVTSTTTWSNLNGGCGIDLLHILTSSYSLILARVSIAYDTWSMLYSCVKSLFILTSITFPL